MTDTTNRHAMTDRTKDSGHDTVLALVPHFRCERWLDHCLSSLVGQTRPPDGIVVIDDASPSPPLDIVRRHRNVTLLRAARNVGPYRLVQQVIDDTDANWYLFQDADDWSAPDRLERQLAAAMASGAELVGSDYVMLTTDEGLTVPHAFPADVNAALAASPTCHALQHPTSLVARDLVQRLGGYSSGMRFSGDDEFLRRAIHAARVTNVAGMLYFRRHRAESLTTSDATGHGSPARQAVLAELAARATANAAAAERGSAPQLEPYDRAGPIELEHLFGPVPLDPATRSRPTAGLLRRARRRRSNPAQRAASRRARPILVVGGPTSGADALLWALGQHPSLSVLVDASWLAPLEEIARRATEAAPPRHLALSTARRFRPLDTVGAGPDEVWSALGPALVGLASAGAGRETTLLAMTPPDPALLTTLLALLPDAVVIHLVRDADHAAATMSRRSKAISEPMPALDAYRAWLDTARRGLECERIAGAGRVLRLAFDDLVAEPAAVMARCLALAGLAEHPACARPLEGFEIVGPSVSATTTAKVATEARDLSTALCGPTPPRPRRPAPRASGPDDVGATVELVAATVGPLPDHVAVPGTLLRDAVPPGAVVAVVTKGEGRFRELPGAEVWHFPQTPDGEWAGYHPATVDDVTTELEELRRRGACYLLIPQWAAWWLEHYEGLREHLLAGGALVAESPTQGSLFELGPRPSKVARGSPARVRPQRRSVSVVSWSTTHNPLGRAHVLAELLRDRYDVELVGPRFDRFGTETWPPLRDMDIPLRSFPGGAFPDLFALLEDFASTITSDAVVVSKPRLPSYLLGMMTKAVRARPLVLDVDDRELTFVGADEPRSLPDLEHLGDEELANPHGRWWTQLCESVVTAADQVTVSGPALQELFGGTIVPHARDERVFDPARVDRGEARQRFGFGPDERIVLFGGTPRRHKGVVELAAALHEIGDPRARLCVIGTSELDALWGDLEPYSEMIRVVPPQPFATLPHLLAAADMVAVLQDPDSDVSRFQMPAKITDALAMQLPCLVRTVPPLEPLVRSGHLRAVGHDGLAASVAALLEDLPGARQQALANRELFLSDFSFAAIRPRLEAVVESLLDTPPAIAPEHAAVLAFAEQRFGSKRTGPDGPGGIAPRRARPRDAAPCFDVVMFWKQHDTGLYGRRHDMLMQQLAASPRVARVVQFDAPVDIATLRRPDGDLPTHTALLRERAVARVDGVEAVPGLHQHSFVYTRDGEGGEALPRRSEYGARVGEALDRHGVGERPTVFWVYPKHFDFPAIARDRRPELIVADVVDDHRTWLRTDDPARPDVDRNYHEIAELSDLVLVNCEPMRDVMAAMPRAGGPIHLVANAAEYPDPAMATDVEIPDDLRRLGGPLVGYVGNLSSRIDVDLLDRMATRRPGWQVVLIGSAHAGRAIGALARHPNVTLLGPRPYGDAKRYIRSLDVGIIPHLDDAMTRTMNPLKASVYCALNVPVVSTDIGNLGELRPLISVASDHDDFIDRVETAINVGRRPVDPRVDAVLRRNSWAARTEVITGLLDQALEAKAGARR